MKIYFLLLIFLIFQSCIQLKINKKEVYNEVNYKSTFQFSINHNINIYQQSKTVDDKNYLISKNRSYSENCKCISKPGRFINKEYQSNFLYFKSKITVNKQFIVKHKKTKNFDLVENKHILREKIKLNFKKEFSLKITKLYDNKGTLLSKTIDTTTIKRSNNIIFIK